MKDRPSPAEYAFVLLVISAAACIIYSLSGCDTHKHYTITQPTVHDTVFVHPPGHGHHK